ncbi:Phosphoglycolate phosphatase 2, partial [Cucurbita argyrosperma subsp. argyrosperma]
MKISLRNCTFQIGRTNHRIILQEHDSHSIVTRCRTRRLLSWRTSEPQLLSTGNARDLIDSVEAFLFDCDGVIWKGDKLVDGVVDTLEMLRSKGKKLVFVTNNSSKSRRQYAKKFYSLGISVSEDEIFSSSFAAAMFLKVNNFSPEKKVYVIGEAGIMEELQLAGFTGLGGPDIAISFQYSSVLRPNLTAICFEILLKSLLGSTSHSNIIEFDQTLQVPFNFGCRKMPKKLQIFISIAQSSMTRVGAVVVGIDRHINYYKLQYATLCIRENPGCLFIATNRDAVGHFTESQETPGAGCMVAAVCGSSEKEPILVGKPSTFMMDFLLKKFEFGCSKMCMVGDRLDTDILFGQSTGCKTLLVFSGVTTQSNLQDPSNHIQPDYYTAKVSDLLELSGS